MVGITKLNSNLSDNIPLVRTYMSNSGIYLMYDVSKFESARLKTYIVAAANHNEQLCVFPYKSDSSWLPDPDSETGDIALGGSYHTDDSIYSKDITGGTTTSTDDVIDVSNYEYLYVFASHSGSYYVTFNTSLEPA